MARMPYTFSPMTQANSSEIAAWRYPGTYAIYDMTPPGAEADLSELLDARSPHFAVSDERSELIGFCAFIGVFSESVLDCLYGRAPHRQAQTACDS